MAFDTSAMMLTEEEHGTGAIGLHVAEEDHDTVLSDAVNRRPVKTNREVEEQIHL